MIDQEQNISFQVCKEGTVSAYYHFWEIEDVVVKQITKTVNDELYSAVLANSSIFDISIIDIPECQFLLSKKGNYFHLDFYVIGCNADDARLEFARNLQRHLNKENYPSKITFYNNKTKEKIFEYSKRTYWSLLLRNSAYTNLYVVIFLIIGLFLSNLIFHFLDKYIDNKNILSLIQDNLVSPLLGYPVSVIAFKIWPTIWKTRLITEMVILITVFGYNMFTGYGFIGSLILLGVFLLQQIRDTITE